MFTSKYNTPKDIFMIPRNVAVIKLYNYNCFSHKLPYDKR